MTKGLGLEAVNLLKENFQSRAILGERCGLSGVSPLLVWETGDIWPRSSVLAVTQNEFNQHDFNYFKIN